MQVAESKTALLIIDVQDCFMDANGTASGEDGSLAVADTHQIIPIINDLRTEKACLFDVVVRSQDFHTANHISFGPTHGLDPFAHLAGRGELPLTCVSPDSGETRDGSCCPTYHIEPYDCETILCPTTRSDAVMSSPACAVCLESPMECYETTQAMWTDHCLQDGDSSFPPTLLIGPDDVVVQKGGNQHVDAYSAFMDNTRKLKTELDGVLKGLDVDKIYMVGIATDYCVYYSAVDALMLDYDVTVVLDATRGIASDTVDAALADMSSKGAKIVNSTDVFELACPAASEPEADTESDGTNDSTSSAGSVREPRSVLAVLFLARLCWLACHSTKATVDAIH